MQLTIEKLSPVRVALRAEVPWTDVQNDLQEGYKTLARSANVPGFRRGKAPANVIKKMYGDDVRQRVAQNLAQRAITEAIEKHDVAVLSEPVIRELNIKDGEPFSLSAEIEVRPTIEEVKTEKLTVWRPPTRVTDELVTQEVERLRREHSEVRPLGADQKASAQNIITADCTIRIEGEAEPVYKQEAQRFEMDDEKLLPELRDALVGLKAGESKTADVDFSGKQVVPRLRDKKGSIEVNVKEIHERVLPELDDEFAKDCGDYKTLLELRLKIREQMEAVDKHITEQSLRQQVVDAVAQQNPIELPPSLVYEETRRIFMRQAMAAQQQGVELNPENVNIEAIQKNAEENVRAGLLLGAVATLQKLSVGNEEVDAELQKHAEQTGKHIAKVRAEMKPEQLRSLHAQLLEEKVVSWLLERATIKDGVPPQPKADDKPTDEAPEKKTKAKKSE